MKKLLKYLLFAVMIICMTACPFEALFPLDEPSVKYSPALIGKWIQESELESEYPTYYEIAEYDDYTFLISENSFDEAEESWTTMEYSGHLSDVRGYKFINVYDPDFESYYFYRLDWDDPDQFTIHPVTEYIEEEFESSEELRIFFEKYCELSFFYGEEETYIRSN